MAGIAPSLARWWFGGRSLGVAAFLSGSHARHICINVACQFAERVGTGAQTALSYWPQVKEFLYKLRDATENEIAEFLATGKFPGSEKVGPAMGLAMVTVLSLYVSAMDWWNGREPYKRGYYQGYVLFEVVAAVVSGLLTAPAGGSGAVVVLARHAPKFVMVLKKLGAGLTRIANAAGDAMGPLRDVIDDLVARITGARAGTWYFVAGTMIMTAQGAVAIEQIREGDLVWSAHEETGERGLRPVIELYRNEAEEIWTVRYAGTEDGAPVRELRCTGEHPFWIETERSFVPASELKPGGELRLFGGEVARVLSVTPRRGPPGERTRVYNFAVAEHHTYFAGDGGVWVHNVCPKLIDLIESHYQTGLRIAERKGLFGGAAATDAADYSRKTLKGMRLDDKIDEEEFFEALGYTFRVRGGPDHPVSGLYPGMREVLQTGAKFPLKSDRGISGFMTKDGHLVGHFAPQRIGHEAFASQLGVTQAIVNGDVLAISIVRGSNGELAAFGSGKFGPLPDQFKQIALNLIE